MTAEEIRRDLVTLEELGEERLDAGEVSTVSMANTLGSRVR